MSLGDLAHTALLPKSSLRDWESGRYVPPAGALDRLLRALNADARTRTRLIAWVGSPEAQTMLAHTPWGASVDAGEVLRAMRHRAGSTQADLARTVDVRQGTLAKWEAGDSIPDEETAARLLMALRATPEEVAALRAARHEPSPSIGDPFDRVSVIAYERPVPLREVLLLGLEAELWRGAMLQPSLDSALAAVVSVRAQQALIRGAWNEIAPHARRAVRLARQAGDIQVLAPALYAWHWNRQRQVGGATKAALSLDGWAARMRDPLSLDWLTAAGALAWVRAGEIGEGVRVLRTLLEGEGVGTASRAYYGEDLIEAWLLAGEPERAAEESEALGPDASPLAAAKVGVAAGESPPPELLGRLRASSDALHRFEADRIERLAAQVRRGRTPRLV